MIIVIYFSSIILCGVSFAMEFADVKIFMDIFSTESLEYIGVIALFLIPSFIIINFVKMEKLFIIFKLAAIAIIIGVALSRILSDTGTIGIISSIITIICLIIPLIRYSPPPPPNNDYEYY